MFVKILVVGLLLGGTVQGQECNDILPSRICQMQKQGKNCDEKWMKNGNFCAKTCGSCFEELNAQKKEDDTQNITQTTIIEESAQTIAEEDCQDMRPNFMKYTCQEKKEFGGCDERWIQEGNFCAKTCGRCTPKTITIQLPQKNFVVEESATLNLEEEIVPEIENYGENIDIEEFFIISEEEECVDIRPDFMLYSCEEKKGFGGCFEQWIQEGGYCAKTCERCSTQNVNVVDEETE